jgi:hypothetical protein
MDKITFILMLFAGLPVAIFLLIWWGKRESKALDVERVVRETENLRWRLEVLDDEQIRQRKASVHSGSK